MAKSRRKSTRASSPAPAERPAQERVREYASSPCYAHELEADAQQAHTLGKKSPKRSARRTPAPGRMSTHHPKKGCRF